MVLAAPPSWSPSSLSLFLRFCGWRGARVSSLVAMGRPSYTHDSVGEVVGGITSSGVDRRSVGELTSKSL